MNPRALLAALPPIVVCALQWLFWDYITPYAWFLFFPAAFLSAYLDGLRGGLVGTITGAALVWYVFLPPSLSFILEKPSSAFFSTGVFVATGCLYGWFFEQLHRAQQRSETRFEVTFEQAAVGIALMAIDGQWLRVNRRLCDIVGHDRDEMLKQTAASISHPDDQQLESDWMRRAVEGNEQAFSMEKRLLRKDGSPVWVNLSVALARTPEGKPDYFICVFEDIHARKDAETNLNEAKQLAKLGYWKWELGTNVHLWSDEIYALFGRDSTLPPVAYPEVQRYFTPESWTTLAARVENTLMSGEAFECDAELVRQADGRPTWITARGKAVHDGEGAIIAIHGTVQDITERKLAELEKEHLQEQLLQSQKIESIGRLAGGVAHDFNNMLSVILGHAELALKGLDASPPLAKRLQEIRMAAERSADLTRQLLTFARKQTVSPKILDLNDTIAGMCGMLRRLIGEHIDLVWIPGTNLKPVRMDPSQVDQILMNLCVNARDAIADTGRITIQTAMVTLDAACCAKHQDAVAGEYVLLTVRDNGAGMDKETLSHLFEPFFTTKDMGKGTGLGLATVYGIVRQNNGFIEVSSEPAEETMFRIYLPSYQDAAHPRVRAEATESIGGGHETVLLVEDEPMMLELITTMLELHGYRVLPAAKPCDAIRLARDYADSIHLVLTDVVMPEMNGCDLAKNLSSCYPELKAVFMSGYTDDLLSQHGVLDQGIHFIHKPFTEKELIARVREAIAQPL